MFRTLIIITFLSIISPHSFGANQLKKYVSISEVGIHLEVPSTWHYQAEGDTYYFRDNLAKEQLTLSAFGLKEKSSIEQRQDTMLKLLQHRRNAELEDSGAGVQMTEPQFGEQGDTLLVRYQGSATQGNRQFAFIMFGLPDRVINVYFESLNLSGDSFNQRAQEILNSINIDTYK